MSWAVTIFSSKKAFSPRGLLFVKYDSELRNAYENNVG